MGYKSVGKKHIFSIFLPLKNKLWPHESFKLFYIRFNSQQISQDKNKIHKNEQTNIEKQSNTILDSKLRVFQRESCNTTMWSNFVYNVNSLKYEGSDEACGDSGEEMFPFKKEKTSSRTRSTFYGKDTVNVSRL